MLLEEVLDQYGLGIAIYIDLIPIDNSLKIFKTNWH